MQSAGRAVTCSHQASLYTSSRHALTRPCRCFAAEGTVSQPAVQKRCSSSKSRPPAAPLRPKSNDPKSKPSKPLVYKGREAASPSKHDFASILNSNPYLRGKPISPSGSPNAIFDPKTRRPTVVSRPPPNPPLVPDQSVPPTTTPPASSQTPEPSAPDQELASPSPLPEQELQANPPLTTPSVAPQSPTRLTPSQDHAHAVDDVAVPEGITAADISPVLRSKEPYSNTNHQRMESMESRASVFDEVLRLGDELLHLRQKNSGLEAALAQQRKENLELQKSHEESQQSSARAIEDAQRQARENLQAMQEKHNRERGDLKSAIAKQGAARNKLFLQLHELRQQLEVEKDGTNEQAKRRSFNRQFEATIILREQEEKAARKLLRKDYITFRAWNHHRFQQIGMLLQAPDLLQRRVAWYVRETTYWNQAFKALQTFEGTAKGGDKFRFWDAVEQVQQRSQDPRERQALRQRVIHQLEQRLQHRNSVFGQVKAYLQNSGLEADRARSEFFTELEQLRKQYVTVKDRQHHYRQYLRQNRFHMDPKTWSPEKSASSRAATIDNQEMDRPLASMANLLIERTHFWKRKLKSFEARKNKTADETSMETFYRTQLRVVLASKTLLHVIRTFTSLQLEALEADWISDQPLYQQLFWQTSTRIARRQNHLEVNMSLAMKNLEMAGLKCRGILSAHDVRDIVPHTRLYEGAAFAYAYVKHKKDAFTWDDRSEISEVIAKYRHENVQDSKRYLRQVEHVIKASSESVKTRQNETLGKRFLVPVRTRRREGLRKSALAKTKSDEDAIEERETPVVEAAPGTTTDLSRSASDAEMTSKDTSTETTAGLEKDEAPQQESAQSLEDNMANQSDPTASTAFEETSADSPESLPPAEHKPRGPVFKLVRQGSASVPRLTPKVSTVYSRARSRLGFRPPKPMFKETRRRSQSAGTSSADHFDKEELDRSTILPPLLYQIPPQDLRNALMASKTSQAAFWRYSLYKSPSGEKPRLHYCTKFEQAEQVAKFFSGEQIIGFDIEWEMGSSVSKSSIKDNVSLIQIACDDRIALFQVALFAGESKEDLMPPSLKAILESPSILKTGVNIAGDFTRLRRCLGVEGQGIFELSHLYKLVKFSEKEPAKVNKSPLKLAEQVQDVLFLPLSKGNVRTSAWSRRLSMEQVEYAATDAYAGFRLFRELDKARTNMNPMPPRPALWEASQPIILGNGERAGETRPKRKAATEKATEAESQPAMLSVEEEQALNDEEEEAQAEAGTDDIDDDNSQDELESFDPEPVVVVKYEAAENWLGQWESSISSERKGKNTPTNMRAYALWHIQGLTLQEVAESMREPPLALTTVASYVLEAVKSEGLPYESARLQEAMDVLPSVAHWRYRRLIQKTRSEI